MKGDEVRGPKQRRSQQPARRQDDKAEPLRDAVIADATAELPRDRGRFLPGFDVDGEPPMPHVEESRAIRHMKRGVPGFDDLPDDSRQLTPEQRNRLNRFRPREDDPRMVEVRKRITELQSQIDDLKPPRNPIVDTVADTIKRKTQD